MVLEKGSWSRLNSFFHHSTQITVVKLFIGRFLSNLPVKTIKRPPLHLSLPQRPRSSPWHSGNHLVCLFDRLPFPFLCCTTGLFSTLVDFPPMSTIFSFTFGFVLHICFKTTKRAHRSSWSVVLLSAFLYHLLEIQCGVSCTSGFETERGDEVYDFAKKRVSHNQFSDGSTPGCLIPVSIGVIKLPSFCLSWSFAGINGPRV